MFLKLSSVISTWKAESCDKGIKIEKTALPRSSLPLGNPSLLSPAFVYTVSPGGMPHANSFNTPVHLFSANISIIPLRCPSPPPCLCCWPLSHLVIELFLFENTLLSLWVYIHWYDTVLICSRFTNYHVNSKKIETASIFAHCSILSSEHKAWPIVSNQPQCWRNEISTCAQPTRFFLFFFFNWKLTCMGQNKEPGWRWILIRSVLIQWLPVKFLWFAS